METAEVRGMITKRTSAMEGGRTMKIKRKIVQIDEEKCNGCGVCTTACAEGAIALIDGKAKLVKDSYCDGLGACLGECPVDAIRIIEREADAFDEKEVEHYLEQKRQAEMVAKQDTGSDMNTLTQLPCGCPSTMVKTFGPACNEDTPSIQESVMSSLTHWPVQIGLIPSTAPFLKGADLLVAADCTPVAYPNFHRDLLRGRTVMVGCPKFDETDEYIRKFAEIFRTAGIKSVTVAIMEVPCCSKLPLVVRKGMELAGAYIPVEVVVIGSDGTILRREQQAA